MAFRADEAAKDGFQEAETYLVGRLHGVEEADRVRSRSALRYIAEQLGPVIDTYPTWHPLVANHNPRSPVTTPCDRSGYRGLDHTIFFVNGFITCPYGDGGQQVIDSVEALPRAHTAHITAELLDIKFYHVDASPVLVKCNWENSLSPGELIPLSLALPLLLEQEVPCWRWAERAETWESMRHYFLGSPRGSRSSLFVSQDTGQAMKKVWEALISSGMFGPVKA